MERKRCFRWRHGNGEMIGFAVCAGILTVVMVSIMAFMNYSIRAQQLTVAAYAVGRAAVVSSDEQLAKARAFAVLKTIYGEDHSGNTESDLIDNAWYTIEYDGDWKVGKIVTVSVYQHIGAIFPLKEQNIKRSIAMMIEDQPDY